MIVYNQAGNPIQAGISTAGLAPDDTSLLAIAGAPTLPTLPNRTTTSLGGSADVTNSLVSPGFYSYTYRLAASAADAAAAKYITFAAFTAPVTITPVVGVPIELDPTKTYFVYAGGTPAGVRLATTYENALAGNVLSFSPPKSSITLSTVQSLFPEQPWVSGEEIRLGGPSYLPASLSPNRSYFAVVRGGRLYLAQSPTDVNQNLPIDPSISPFTMFGSASINNAASTLTISTPISTGTPDICSYC